MDDRRNAPLVRLQAASLTNPTQELIVLIIVKAGRGQNQKQIVNCPDRHVE